MYSKRSHNNLRSIQSRRSFCFRDFRKMKYEDAIDKLGGFGKYQKILLILVAIPVCFDGITTMMLAFFLGDHAHRCKIPGTEDIYSNPSSAMFSNVSMYNVTECSLKVNGTESYCTEWVYDTQTYQSTLISKFNMVCKDRFMRSHILLSHFFGTFINAIMCGVLCDVFGRRPILIIGIFLLIVPNFIRPWLNTTILVALCEFLNAAGSNMTYVVPFTLVTELVDPAHRVLASFTIYFSYCVGSYMLLFYAYLIRDWETLILVIAAPITICFFIFIFVTESPRWLLLKGRTEEAMSIFRKTAKYNNAEIDFKASDIKISEEKRTSVIQGLKIVFKSKKILIRFIILYFNWFSISLIYFGISMNTGDLGGNVYINYAISTTVETAAVIFCFFANKWPRKKIYCPAMIIGGAACLCTIFTSVHAGKDLQWITVALAMVGKLGVTTAFFLIYLITSEVFPTVIRASLFGLCSSGARIGSMSSSYIGKLGVLIDSDFANALPLVIFGSVGTTAGLLSLLLPETRDRDLPDTFEDSIHSDRSSENSSITEENIAMIRQNCIDS